MRKDHVATSEFIALHSDVLPLLMNPEHLAELTSAQSRWMEHKGALAAVCRHKVGLKMFGFAQNEVLTESVTQVLIDVLDELLKPGCKVTSAFLSELQEAAMEATEGIEGACNLRKRRVRVQYLGASIEVTVNSANEELDLRIAARLKLWGLASGQLASFLSETDLGDPTDVVIGSVAEELLYKTKMCRDKANKLWSEHSNAADVEVVKQLLSSFFRSVDPTSVLEVSFLWQMVDSAGEQALYAKVRALLPTADVDKQQFTPKATIAGIEGIEKLQLYKMSSRSVQGHIQAVKGIVAALAQNRAPKIPKGQQTSFMSGCLNRIEHFCRCKVSVKGVTVEKSGRDAAVEKMRQLREKRASEAGTTMDDVADVVPWQWMLSEADRGFLDAELTKAVKQAGGEVAAASSSKRGAASAKAAATKKARSEQVAQEVAALFTKWK
jgi:hypothetical protein